MKKYLLITLAVTTILLGGCASIYTSIVTITQVRKSAMNEYGELYRKGLTTAKIDAQVEKIDAQFLVAAKATQQSLELYKAGMGQEGDYVKNLQTVRGIVFNLLTIIEPLLESSKSNQLNTQLANAKSL